MSGPVLVVGAGLFGSVMAERIASQLHLPVTVIDKRSHIGGNCWSEKDAVTGIECHKYGPHIFHTSHEEVWNYISNFTEWNTYRHHVWTRYKEKIYPFPINLQTINAFYGRDLSPGEARKFIAAEAAREGIAEPLNLEEKAISLMGRPLYQAFVRGHALKQWGTDPRELPAELLPPVPLRFSLKGHFFADRWEGLPLKGYAKLFERLLAHPLITVRLNTDWFDIRDTISADTLVIYTGPIDQFFDYQLGRLEWRTVKFEIIHYDMPDFQGASVINNADSTIPYTRTTEYAHFSPEKALPHKTVVFNEYPHWACPLDEPYYPILNQRNRELYERYAAYASRMQKRIFGGRLGAYKQYDMDETVANSLNAFKQVSALLRAAE